jgi:hypothetical protein
MLAILVANFKTLGSGLLVSGTRRAFRRVGARTHLCRIQSATAGGSRNRLLRTVFDLAASGARLRLARRTAKRLQVLGDEI